MHALIFVNGPIQPSQLVADAAHRADLLIAADGGARHALALGLRPHVLIGDMDSLSPGEVSAFQGQGTEILRHPARKDKTDLELALDLAADRGADAVTLLGALGARWDMTMASIMLMAADRFAFLNIRIIDGNQSLRALRGPGVLSLSGKAGDGLSLLAMSTQARGVTLTGLVYPLSGADIERGSTWGVSNIFVAEKIVVELQEGLMLVTHTRVESPSERLLR